MKKLKYLCLFLFLNLVISIPLTSDASQVDFGWSVPEYFSTDDDSEDKKKYLIWVFSIRNTIDKEITVPVATLLSTDTDKYYEPKYIPEIAEKVSEDGEKYLSSDNMKGEYAPGTSTVVPVLGFLPILDPLSTVVRMPKSLNSNRLPFTSSSVHNSRKS